MAASKSITIRIPLADRRLAKEQAFHKGLKYQTYLKMLIHLELHRVQGVCHV